MRWIRQLTIFWFVILFLLSGKLGWSEDGLENKDIPDGFVKYVVKPGDRLEKIAPREQWDLIKKVNRLDEKHLIVGQKILIPDDWEKAQKYCPVPMRWNNADKVLAVFLDTQYFGAYENGQLLFWGPISSGKNNSTPAGEFKVLWKSRYYVSKKYNARMDYAVNFSSEGYFLHQQSLPGKPASHGCVRLLKEDAQRIFEWLEKGDKIIILEKQPEN